MIKTIYNVAKKEMDFGKIRDFLDQNMTLISDDSCNEGYYKESTRKYSLTPSFNIVATYSFDIFGNNKTGGYFICIEDIMTEEMPSIFEHSVTIIDGKREEDEKTICEKSLIENFLEKIKEDSDFSEENFVVLMETNSNNAISYWKNLPKDIRLKKTYIDFILETLYEKAIGKLDEIRDYDMISPYGGLDITYYPKSYGECFFDMAKKLLPFMETTKKNYYAFLIEFIEKKDATDEYITSFKKNVKLANIIRKNKDIVENIKLYNSCLLREETLERLEVDAKMDCKYLEKRTRILSERLEELRTQLNTNSLVEKILLDVFGKRTKEKERILRRIESIELECKQIDVDINVSRATLERIGKRLKKLSYVLNNDLYKDLEKEFASSLDENSFDEYINERKVSDSKYRNFIKKYSDYAI